MSTPNYSEKRKLNFSPKWSLLGLFIYLIITVIGSALLSSMWISSNDISNLSHQEIAVMMDKDIGFAVYTSVLGAFGAVFCGWLATKKAAYQNYYTALIIASCLALYGVISILIHPDHTLLHQVAKIIAPFLFCGLGAKLAR